MVNCCVTLPYKVCGNTCVVTCKVSSFLFTTLASLATRQSQQNSSDGVPTPGASPGVSHDAKPPCGMHTQQCPSALRHPTGDLDHRKMASHRRGDTENGGNAVTGMAPFGYGVRAGYPSCWHGDPNFRTMGLYSEDHHSADLSALLGVHHVGPQLEAPSTANHLMSSSDLEYLDNMTDGSSEGSPSASNYSTSYAPEIFTSSATEILGPIVSGPESFDSDLSVYQGMMVGPNLTDLQLLDEDPPLHYEPPSSPPACAAQNYPLLPAGYVSQARARYTTIASAFGGLDCLAHPTKAIHGSYWQGWKLNGTTSAPVH